MIYTLTLNPALDITITTDVIKKDSINKTKLKSVSAGGKGFNTSRGLNCLKTGNTAIAFVVLVSSNDGNALHTSTSQDGTLNKGWKCAYRFHGDFTEYQNVNVG